MKGEFFSWASADPQVIEIRIPEEGPVAEIILDGRRHLGYPKVALERRGLRAGVYHRPADLDRPFLMHLIP